MSGGTLATLVPAAVGVGLSPIPVIEMILVLFSRRRGANAVAFVLVLIAGTAAVVLLGVAQEQATSGHGTSRGTGAVLLAVGALLLVIAWRNWRRRGDPEELKVFGRIAGMGPAAAALLALGAVALNPKNLVLLLAAGHTIGESDAASEGIVVAAFVVAATLPYTVATAYALLGGTAADAKLDRARAWLVARARLLIAIVFGVVGLVLVSQGVAAL